LEHGINSENLIKIIGFCFRELEKTEKQSQDAAVECFSILIKYSHGSSSEEVAEQIFPKLFLSIKETKKNLSQVGKSPKYQTAESTSKLILHLKILDTLLQNYGNYSIISNSHKELIDILSSIQLFDEISLKFHIFHPFFFFYLLNLSNPANNTKNKQKISLRVYFLS
jgi:hypothetical protein